MEINFNEHRIIVGDKTIWLTKIENTILELLYINKENVVSYQDIAKAIYQLELDEMLKRLISKHISVLRKKVNQYIEIKNVRDVGYVMEVKRGIIINLK